MKNVCLGGIELNVQSFNHGTDNWLVVRLDTAGKLRVVDNNHWAAPLDNHRDNQKVVRNQDLVHSQLPRVPFHHNHMVGQTEEDNYLHMSLCVSSDRVGTLHV